MGKGNIRKVLAILLAVLTALCTSSVYALVTAIGEKRIVAEVVSGEQMTGASDEAVEEQITVAEAVSEEQVAAAEAGSEELPDIIPAEEFPEEQTAEIPSEEVPEEQAAEIPAEEIAEIPAEEIVGEMTDGMAEAALPEEQAVETPAVLAETAFDQTVVLDDIQITVKAEAGIFPEGAVLSAEMIPVEEQERADEAVDAVRGENANVAASYTVDVKVTMDGEEIRPAEGRNVEVSFRSVEVGNANLDASIYHITGEADSGQLVAEQLTAAEDDQEGTVKTETDGFSYYTVEFTYNDLQYTLNGGSTVALSEILGAVGLVGEAESASVSNEELLSVENTDSGWIVTVHNAFTTEEWMYVTVGGIEYRIRMTDDLSEIMYLDENGVEQICAEYMPVSPSMDSNTTNGWYALVNNQDWGDTAISTTGDVHLILCDGCELNLKGGIRVNGALTIYCQNEDTDACGRIIVKAPGEREAIGGKNVSITINGGKIIAEGGIRRAGIGGDRASVTINGGEDGSRTYIDVQGGLWNNKVGNKDYIWNHAGTGIGSGMDQDSGPITINGGTVIATGGPHDAGIGSGSRGHNGPITINGGIVEARTFTKNEISVCTAAAIGAGNEREQSGDIIINGGTVKATSEGQGAGIGGSAVENGGTIVINGGDVTAVSVHGAGIGGGGGGVGVNGGNSGGSGGNIIINDGNVFAMSSSSGSGIGGGNDGSGGNITINGGTVMAVGGSTKYSWLNEDGGIDFDGIEGDPVDKYFENTFYSIIADLVIDWIFSGDYAGAGIGGGDDDSGGDVNINGGVVIALGGKNGSTAAIGRGDGSKNNGNLSIYDNAKVTYGNLDTSTDPKSAVEVGVKYKADPDERITVARDYAYVKIEPGVKEIKVNKIWSDADNQDGIRPDSVTVRLLADGSETGSTLVLSEANSWEDTFTNLATMNGSHQIDYSVTEETTDVITGTDGEGTYAFEVAGDAETGFTVTNTHTPAKVTISGKKVWDDAENQDALRPESVKILLKADGKKIDEKNVTSKDNWEFRFPPLEKYMAGKAINYTVEEETTDVITGTDGEGTYAFEVAGIAETGFTITNTHTPAKVTISGKKVWNDAEDQDGLRPESVKILLKADGKTIAEKTVTSQDNWEFSFPSLEKYTAGKAINYTVEEETTDVITGTDGEGTYAFEVTGDAETGFTVTNTHTPAQITITGKKVWNDAENQDGLRPESVKILLKADGKTIAEETVTSQDNWEFSFPSLEKYTAGKAINYTVEEETTDVITGTDGEGTYAFEVTGDADSGFTVMNTHTPATVTVEGAKTWDDAENQDGLRPESITIRLKADGEEISSAAVTAADEWKWSFADLPKYNAGQEIIYTITEDAVANYTPEVNGFDITNTHTPGKTSVSVTKKWEDGGNKDGIRPDAVVVKLFANGEDTGKKIKLSEENHWMGAFTDVDALKAGAAISYSVEEVTTKVVTGTDGEGTYAFKVTGDAMKGFTITNTHTPKEKVQKCQIRYELNGGSYTGIKASVIVELRLLGDVISIRTAPTRSGYRFLYWKGSEYHPGDQYKVVGDHTFVAQWEKVTQTVVRTNTVKRANTSTADKAKTGKEAKLPTKKSIPNTGDTNNIALWVVLFVLAAVVLGGALYFRRKKSGK